MSNILLRPFNGSLDDARGILTIDRATFNDCPYSAEQIVHLLTAGEQQAWVAEMGGSVAGFVTAFPTRTLQADGWEVDLLAVHPQHQRRGIGRALIGQAVNGAAGSGAMRVRAVAAVNNRASRRAFEAVGFREQPQTYHLMRCDLVGATIRPPVPGTEAVRPLINEADARQVLRLAPAMSRSVSEVTRLADARTNTYLVIERHGRFTAFVELLKVQTLLYAGVWVETLRTGRSREATLLIATAVEWAKAEGLDEIGCLVAVQDWRLHHALVGEGFTSAGEYLVLMRTL